MAAVPFDRRLRFHGRVWTSMPTDCPLRAAAACLVSDTERQAAQMPSPTDGQPHDRHDEADHPAGEKGACRLEHGPIDWASFRPPNGDLASLRPDDRSKTMP
jgi:hypothetical protein